jgi:hypothetical protein
VWYSFLAGYVIALDTAHQSATEKKNSKSADTAEQIQVSTKAYAAETRRTRVTKPVSKKSEI